ncbi:hypothetical protein VTK56DRAFT_9765 [Thermocarpiscus australiensis]
MHLNWATPLLSAVSFSMTCLSLPFNEHRLPRPHGLELRATYSVVPIYGGSGPGGSGSSDGSGSGSGPGSGQEKPSGGALTVTVVETLPARTSFHTIYKTSPPVTDRVTDTVIITKTIQIVNVAETTSSTAITSLTRTTPMTSSQPTATRTTLSPSSLAAPISTPIPSNLDCPTAISGSVKSPTTTVIPLHTASSSSSGTTYDNGIWHTSYPAWNGTQVRRSFRQWPRPQPLA